MEKELVAAIKYLTEEINSLSGEIEELRKVNREMNEKLYLTNEYLSTLR